MRNSFEKNLHNYRDLAKDQLKLREDNDPTISLDKLQSAIDWNIKRGAKNRDTDENSQRDIFMIQKKKQELMSKLKKDMSYLDKSTTSIEWGENTIPLDYQDGNLVTKKGDLVTTGEMITDLSWNIQYQLDTKTPRDIQKKYLVEKTKNELQKLLDAQITLDETSNRTINPGLKEAYIKKQQAEESRDLPPGIIAEVMVQNFMKKLCIDHSMSFEIIPADVYQDITMKMDFIIHRKSYYRGVQVDTHNKGEIGVQFLSNENPEKIKQKEEQLNRSRQFLKTAPKKVIDDFILVSIPLEHTFKIYKKWQLSKRPGGPDKLWDEETKEVIFKKTLKDILTPEEIEEQWKSIQAK